MIAFHLSFRSSNGLSRGLHVSRSSHILSDDITQVLIFSQAARSSPNFNKLIWNARVPIPKDSLSAVSRTSEGGAQTMQTSRYSGIQFACVGNAEREKGTPVMTEGFLWRSSVFTGKSWESTSIRSLPLHYKPIPIHYSSIFLIFDAS
jgi:hypothetical protein